MLHGLHVASYMMLLLFANV